MTKRKRLLRMRIAVLGSTMLIASTLTLAEQPAADLYPGAGETSGGGIQEIVVTAQKRSENLQNVPIAVSALNADTLQSLGIVNLQDVTLHVPSLQMSMSLPTQISYKIRGLGNEGDILTFEPEVALFYDGAYRLKGFGANDLMDIERIEVLKGPQSTLYGKNATAGVVNIVTGAPSQDFKGGFEADIENYQSEVRGFVNGGLTETVSGRVSYFYLHGTDAIQTNLGASSPGGYAGQQWGVRPQLEITPSDQLSIRVISSYADRNSDALNPAIYYTPADVAVESAVIANPAALAAADPDHLTDGKINPDARPFNPAVLSPNADRRDVTQFCRICANISHIKMYEGMAIIDYDFGPSKLTSISSYDRYEGNLSTNGGTGPLDLVRYDRGDSSQSIAQEIRLTSQTKSDFQWMVGGYYYHNKVQDATSFVLGQAIDEYGIAAFGTTRVYGLPGDSDVNYARNLDELYTAFADMSYAVTDNFVLRFGGRYAYEDKRGDAYHTLAVSPRDLGTSLVEFLTTDTFQLSDHFDHGTGNFTAEYHFTPYIMAYGTFSTAYKSGGFNLGLGARAATSEYAPEKVRNLEVGLKGTFLDRRLQMDLAAFDTKLDGYQAASFQGFAYGVGNADAVTKGLETDLLAKLGAGFSLNVNATYLDAYFHTFSTGTCYPGNPSVTPGTNGANCDLSGQRLPYSARFRGSMGLGYDAPNGFYGRVDQFYTSEYNANTDLDPRSVQGGYGLTDARLGWKFKTYDVSLFVHDISDKTYLVEQIANAVTLGPGLQGWLGGHRMYGATLRVTF